MRSSGATVMIGPHQEDPFLHMQLKDMAIGAKGRVKSMTTSTPEYRRRLLMLGVTPGSALEVVRVAPLGDPIEIRIRGCLITVRKDEAEILDIDPIG